MSIERRVQELMQQYRRSTHTVTIGGKLYYAKEGDLLLDAEGLRLYAEDQARAEVEQIAPPKGISRLKLSADESGRPFRWRKGLVLTYAVRRCYKPDGYGEFTSAEEYQAVVDAMHGATRDWENTCGVNFEHLQTLDDGAEGAAGTAGPLFEVVRLDTKAQIVASAFFPSSPSQQRRVIIYPSFFSPELGFPQVGVLRHELGHVLGFRHEHIDSHAPAECHGEIPGHVIDATQYDPRSVMHYFCGGVGSKTLAITALDRQASIALYGPPDREVNYCE
jgi:hypothetical protein